MITFEQRGSTSRKSGAKSFSPGRVTKPRELELENTVLAGYQRAEPLEDDDDDEDVDPCITSNLSAHTRLPLYGRGLYFANAV